MGNTTKSCIFAIPWKVLRRVTWFKSQHQIRFSQMMISTPESGSTNKRYEVCITNTSLLATFEVQHSDDFQIIAILYAVLNVQVASKQPILPFEYWCRHSKIMDNDTLSIVNVDCYRYVPRFSITGVAAIWGECIKFWKNKLHGICATYFGNVVRNGVFYTILL
jgi:hypothetical protein